MLQRCYIGSVTMSLLHGPVATVTRYRSVTTSLLDILLHTPPPSRRDATTTDSVEDLRRRRVRSGRACLVCLSCRLGCLFLSAGPKLRQMNEEMKKSKSKRKGSLNPRESYLPLEVLPSWLP